LHISPQQFVCIYSTNRICQLLFWLEWLGTVEIVVYFRVTLADVGVFDNKEGILSVWKQKRLLGSGASADVYEYADDNDNSKVIKSFKSF
jgi:hypothetical protein